MSDLAWTDFFILLSVGVLSVLVLALIWCIRDALKDRRHARRRSLTIRPPARGDTSA